MKDKERILTLAKTPPQDDEKKESARGRPLQLVEKTKIM